MRDLPTGAAAYGPSRFLPKLIFSSPSGRLEVSTRPDGGVRLDMVGPRDDELSPQEVRRLIEKLAKWQCEAQADARDTEAS